MQVSEVMHKGINAVNINESVKRVAELMRKEDIGAVPIMENEKTVGFVTDRDIVINCVASGYNLEDSISHAMTKDVYSVKEDDDIDMATKLMKEKQVSRILVVDQQEMPIGMLSLHDLVETNEKEKNAETLSEIKKQ